MRTNLHLAVIAIALAAAPARAEQEIAIRASSTFAAVTDEGVYAVGSGSALVQAELSYAHTLARLGPGLLWIEGSYTAGSRSEHSLYGRFDTSLFAQQFTAGARWSWPVLRWLAPHVRLGLGALVGELDLRGTAQSASDAWSAAFTSYALAGVTLTIPRRPRADGSTPFTAGIVIEGGGLFSSPLAFHTAPDHPDNLLTIPTTGADLGALTLTGPVFRAGIVARF
mgnify:CR=1 FL=1